MDGTAIVATAVGTILGVVSTLAADQVRWRRERSERDRDALRAAFTLYLTAVTQARDAFARAGPAPDRVGRGHLAMGEHGVYSAQQQVELVAPQAVADMAGGVTLAVLDFYDAVTAGHPPDSTEYVQAWRAVRDARRALLGAMRAALRS
ncbi:hypothetical protein [Streptomyces sp. NPDC021020]|uniref:hypothetical protein n=1 Tax=Streptomyces sp. NPDC021020 TaxID=3365109 RepID=UPI0037B592C9